MRIFHRHLWWVLLVAALAIALLLPRLNQRQQVNAVDCPDIVTGCVVGDAKLRVRFDRQPSPLQKFRIAVDAPAARQIHARFSMRDMEMGLNRYRLIPDGNGHWQAEVMLPVCVQGRNDWLLQLEVDGKSYLLPFTSEGH